MNPAQKMLLVSFLLLGSFSVHSEIKSYQSTDNTGQNKYERIDSVEKYLTDLAGSLKNMESKLDENAKKIQALDSAMKAIKDEQAKAETKLSEGKKLGESKASPSAPTTAEQSEVEKLKADVLALKNQDIEKLKVNLEDLSDTVKAMQATLKTQVK